MTKHLDEINKGEFMENTKKTNEQGNTGIGNQATGVKQAEDRSQHQPAKTGGETAFNNTATEAVDQAKQVVTDAYNRASKSLNESYSQALDYGRENPGKTTLIAFGAGIGIGLLLAGNLGSSRNSRTGRIVPPVMNALTEIAREVFR
jgi:ElaB/YqjD/DUF883 family membrane-anchored ribosome-binding protein